MQDDQDDVDFSYWDLLAGGRARIPVGGPVVPLVEIALVLGHSGSESGEVKLWEVASGRELRGWKHTDEVRSVTFSPDGRLAVWVSFDGAITFEGQRSGSALGHGTFLTPNSSPTRSVGG